MSDDQRIAKLLARAGIASRREVERMIAEGRVALDGKVLDTPATILRNLNGVTVDGDPVEAPSAARLYLYHKPPGLLVTERDPAGRPTIYDRLPKDLPRVVPVGRLDLNTEGLLLLTTDGGLKRQLELPATGIERAYRARAYGAVTQAQLEDLIEGVEIEGVRYGSINANIERRTGANVWIEMILTEGKNREVRRVLEFLGLQVSRLIRTRYGPFVLADLPPGQIGEVTQHDVVAFQKELSRPRPAGPGARANIGVSASAPAGAGIGGRPSNPRAAAPRPVPVSIPPRPAIGSRPVPTGSRPVRPGSPERPARPPRPEPIRPTAAMQRGDTTAPWAKPARGPRPTATATATPFRPEPHRGDRGEELSTSPKIKHFRAAKPPRNAKPETTRIGGVAGRDTIKRPPRAGPPGRTETPVRDPAAKRAARSAGGRPMHPDEARPTRTPRSDGPRGARPPRADGPAKPARPGKGPSGGRGHPPRAKR